MQGFIYYLGIVVGFFVCGGDKVIEYTIEIKNEIISSLEKNPQIDTFPLFNIIVRFIT